MAGWMLSNEAEELLYINEVDDEWEVLLREDPILNQSVNNIADTVKVGSHVPERSPVPERHNILRAFSYMPPQRVKVVIVGHEPINDSSLATGLSFSYPRGKHIDDDVGNRYRPKMHGKGKSVPFVHDALCAAGILERGGTYDCCHEVWAERGVLLLNASLIFHDFGPHNTREFIKEILFQVANYSRESRVFYLCWGTDGEVIGKWLYEKLFKQNVCVKLIMYDDDKDERKGPGDAKFVIYIGHHPTYPRDEYGVKFNFYLEQASNQFKEINEIHPGVFDLTNLKAVEADTKGEENRVEETEDMRRLREASLAQNVGK